jgi:hypothetical protein
MSLFFSYKDSKKPAAFLGLRSAIKSRGMCAKFHDALIEFVVSFSVMLRRQVSFLLHVFPQKIPMGTVSYVLAVGMFMGIS